MSGQRIGYKRVSTIDQNVDRRLDGIELDMEFVDRASGKDADRPQLKAAIDYVRTGDTLYIHTMDRLGRNLEDLRSLVDRLTAKGVTVEFVKNGLIFNGADDATAKLMMNILGSFAEFERALIRERQLEGIAKAKENGTYKGRGRALTAEQIADLQARAAAGETKTTLATAFNISRRSVYTYLQ